MILLVNDANILIDLLKTDLIEQFFGLNIIGALNFLTC